MWSFFSIMTTLSASIDCMFPSQTMQLQVIIAKTADFASERALETLATPSISPTASQTPGALADKNGTDTDSRPRRPPPSCAAPADSTGAPDAGECVPATPAACSQKPGGTAAPRCECASSVNWPARSDRTAL